jgi:hypothetical protein
MSKLGLHYSFGHLKHKLWPKEGLGVKLAIWLTTTKSQESTQFTYLQMMCNIPLESSQQKLQLCFRIHLNWRFTCKVMGSKVMGVPTWAISRLPLGNPGTKNHLNVGPIITKYTIKEKVVASPKSRPWWVLCVHVVYGSS